MHTERVVRGGWALWLLLVVFAFWGGEARGRHGDGGVRGRGRVHDARGSQALPPALRAAYLAARQAEGGAEYAVQEGEGGLVANNPTQGFSVAFSEEGVTLAGAGAPHATLTPVRFGCAGEMREVSRARPELRQGRVAFPREGFVEWYVNGPFGLEQGFSIQEAPPCAGAPAEALEVELGVGEGLSASLEAGGEQITLRDGAGQRVLGVSELYALDAKGNALPARLGVTSAHGISMRVETAGAAYPVVIDPLIVKEQQRLFPSGGIVGDEFGFSVALSGDTALVGASGNSATGLGAGAAYVFLRQGASWTEQAKLYPSDGAAGDAFGVSVALSGDTALVGASYTDEKGTDAGAAYVFLRQGASWSQQQKLLPSDGAANGKFGYAVAISGDTALVGARKNVEKGQDAGTAYVFFRKGASWSQQQKLLPSDGVANDFFGDSVALSGDTALVGAFSNDEKGQEAGAAYVFVRQGASWTEQAKLLPSDGAAGDAFGFSVAISGETAIVGAFNNAEKGSGAGAAYVFVRQGASWSQQAKLLASDGKIGSTLGYAVAISSDTALVGARNNDEKGQDAGAAYVFVRQGASWSQQAKLLASDGTESGRFGFAVALSDDTALIGADKPLSAGASYTFVRQGASWTQQQEILPSAGTGNDTFGNSVAISGETAIVGAPFLFAEMKAAGAAYVFVREGSSWTQQAKLLPSDGFAGDAFGGSVAISGDTALVGAYENDEKGDRVGAAYVFLRKGASWSQQAKLLPSDGMTDDLFGVATALSGDTALVGALKNAAYVFVREGASWTQQAKLLPNDEAGIEDFGWSVALSGDTALVGALQNDGAGLDTGAAYVFVRKGASWSQQAKLIPSERVGDDYFGFSVALSGDTALVGAFLENEKGLDVGAAYVFLRKGASWSQQAKLIPSDGAAYGGIDNSVALSGDTALVSSSTEDAQGKEVGAAYVFLRQGASWSQQTRLLASDGTAEDQFGQAVALSGKMAIVGAPSNNPQMRQAGAAYAFVLTETPCSKDIDCPAPLTEDCAVAVCNTATGTCGTRPKPAGECNAETTFGGCDCATRVASGDDAFGPLAMLLLGLLTFARRRSLRE